MPRKELNMKISTGTITRTVLLLLALANQILCIFGLSPIPVEDETVIEFITTGAVIITSVIAFWKNNSFTKEAIQADGEMKKLKGKG